MNFKNSNFLCMLQRLATETKYDFISLGTKIKKDKSCDFGAQEAISLS